MVVVVDDVVDDVVVVDIAAAVHTGTVGNWCWRQTPWRRAL